VPGQRCALNTNWEFTNSSEDPQMAKDFSVFVFLVAGDHLVELAEEFFRLVGSLPFYCLRHHACSGFRNCAARTLKGNVGNSPAFELQIDSQLIAAEWVMSFGDAIEDFRDAKVSRLLVVVQNYLLIKLV
jgi:hypothetical protein